MFYDPSGRMNFVKIDHPDVNRRLFEIKYIPFNER